MTSHDARPSGRSGCTPFEEELVNAMNDFVNASDAPDFDPAGIVRRARRKRTTVIAGIAATLIVAGGGTALASAVSHDAKPTSAKPAAVSKPAATHTSVAASKPTATTRSATTLLLVRDIRGAIVPLQLGGMDQEQARMYIVKAGLNFGTVSKAPCTGKQGSVIAVTPHAPKSVAVYKGTVDLTVCSG